MNKYHDGWKARWFKRMVDAGWRFWVWVDPDVMWCHADEPVKIGLIEAEDYFRQFVNTDGEYIPTPYDVAGEKPAPNPPTQAVTVAQGSDFEEGADA
jgi:hypothetical protein